MKGMKGIRNGTDWGLERDAIFVMAIFGDFPIINLGGPPPPSKSDKTLYTGIYLPNFREGRCSSRLVTPPLISTI